MFTHVALPVQSKMFVFVPALSRSTVLTNSFTTCNIQLSALCVIVSETISYHHGGIPNFRRHSLDVLGATHVLEA